MERVLAHIACLGVEEVQVWSREGEAVVNPVAASCQWDGWACRSPTRCVSYRTDATSIPPSTSHTRCYGSLLNTKRQERVFWEIVST